MNLLRLIGGSNATRANRPHGLVGNYGSLEQLGSEAKQSLGKLRHDAATHLAGVPFLRGFSDADDR